jgi:hypothetical protein
VCADGLPGALVLLAVLVAGLVVGGCAPFGGQTSGTTASPTPTHSVQDQLAHEVLLNTWGLGVQKLETTYDAQHATVQVTITLGGTVPNSDVKASAAEELTKAFCLMAQQALWTSAVPLNAAKVLVQGPEQDPYAGVVTAVYGEAIVEASTARKIDWAAVTADAAWRTYDHEFPRTAFQTID